jgi:TRAP-type C4-dicarboxylate transport system permease small subunit
LLSSFAQLRVAIERLTRSAHFGSKEGLYVAVLEAAYGRMRQIETNLHLNDLEPEDALRRLVEFTYDHHQGNEQFIRLVMSENVQRGEYLAQSKEIQKLNGSALQTIQDLYTRGLKKGVFKKNLTPIEIHSAISALTFFNVSNQHTLVFGNVFLRYGFNSGITLSEELSRWLFVWMTFLGAIVALRSHEHLGTDMLVGRLGPVGQKICMGLSQLLMMLCCYLIFIGAYKQAVINWTSTSAVMEVSLSWVYFPGIIFAVLGGLLIALDFFKLITGQMKDEELMMFQESEEEPHGESR